MRRFVLPLLAALAAPVVAAQDPPDTMVVRLAPVIVEAERHSQRLSEATSAISTVDLESARAYPYASPTDLLSMLPGLGFVSLDGTGHDAQAMVRGFFGGGDAEYVQVLLDGMPINNVEDGLVPWELIDPSALSRVEILRGGSSALYGDAAIGGVMHLHTLTSIRPELRASVHYGSYEAIEGAARYTDRLSDRNVSASVMVDRSDGYRERGRREVASLRATVDLLGAGPVASTLALSSAWRDIQKPGPLSADQYSSSPTSVSPMFAYDRLDERRHSADVSFGSRGSGLISWNARVGGSLREARDISTIPLAATFADTQDRDLSTNGIGMHGQVAFDHEAGKVLVGVDASRSGLESTYYGFFTGSLDDYAQAGPLARGEMANSGSGSRVSAGAYLHAETSRLGPLILAGGIRADQIVDRYTPDGGSETETTRSEISPKASINVEVVNTDAHRLNAFATASESFKAPAVDQLFDQRATPVPFPPFEVTISNGELKPQRGVSREAGLYSQSIIPGRGRMEASVALYRMDMRDELDFSFQEFRLINIGRSRHDGVETGIKYFDRSGFSAYGNYAYQSTTFRNGPNEGNYVKAVPRDVFTAGLSYTHASGVSAGVNYRGARRIFIDDQNANRLDNSDRFDVRASVTVAGATIVGEVFNLFDDRSVSTGFPDPAGTEAVFLYPSAERRVRLGVVYAL